MSSTIILPGSERQHPANSLPAGQPDPDQDLQVTLHLRRRTEVESDAALQSRLSHAELESAYGADPADILLVEAFASRHHLSVAAIRPASRVVVLRGKLSQLTAAFGVEVRNSTLSGRCIRTRASHISLPKELEKIVVAVLGFDERPVAKTNHKIAAHSAQPACFTPPQLAKLYDFPAGTGSGQTIALIELGGGFRNPDLEQYWKTIGLNNNVGVTSVSVDGAQNSPSGDPNGDDGEVVLDIEVAGAVAPGARIAVYFAPNTDAGFLNAINAAIHDTVRKPSIISISWGSPEGGWTSQAMNAFNAAFHDAALLGITVCAAAGDDGSSDGDSDGRNHVDFPASSPWVLSCGGTRLVANGDSIAQETVWNDGTNGGATGGGVSVHFSEPAYQSHVKVPKPGAGAADNTGRGVPDVAGNADPATGYLLFIDGQQNVLGGTSAVAPLWAGLIAICNQNLGHNAGWLHPVLYGTPAATHGALRDITSGTNGAYSAKIGWDCCTGLGTPRGKALLSVLEKK